MIENCKIENIGLYFEEHGNCCLRVVLNNCIFEIPLLKLNKFTRDLFLCFDTEYMPINDFVCKLKGKYIRAEFDKNDKIIALLHITKNYKIRLCDYEI